MVLDHSFFPRNIGFELVKELKRPNNINQARTNDEMVYPKRGLIFVNFQKFFTSNSINGLLLIIMFFAN